MYVCVRACVRFVHIKEKKIQNKFKRRENRNKEREGEKEKKRNGENKEKKTIYELKNNSRKIYEQEEYRE